METTTSSFSVMNVYFGSMQSLWYHLIGAIYSSKFKCKKSLENVPGYPAVFSFIWSICILPVNSTMFKFKNAFRLNYYLEVVNWIVLFLAAYYLKYLKTPYFIFVRDALSYLALVGLHYAFCLAPSSLAFSGLEWSILIFFMGRSLVEYRQIRLTVNRIKERRKSGKDETNSNVLKKALSSYIRWIYSWKHGKNITDTLGYPLLCHAPHCSYHILSSFVVTVPRQHVFKDARQHRKHLHVVADNYLQYRWD